jgi:hypothetical protein
MLYAETKVGIIEIEVICHRGYLRYFAFSRKALIMRGMTSLRSPTILYCAIWKIGASGSVLMAMILLDSAMPARCWMAPEMPAAMYKAGPHGGPGLPDLMLLGDEARVDRRARGSDLAAQGVGQLAHQSWNSASLPTPAPPDTMTAESLSLTLLSLNLSAQDFQGEIRFLEGALRRARLLPLRAARRRAAAS